MEKGNKIATGISAVLIILAIALFVLGLPYILVMAASTTQPHSIEETNYLKNAVKFSILKNQKIYAIDYLLPSLTAQMKYDEAISYYEKYKNYNLTKASKTIITFAYLQKGEYEKALTLAEENNSLYFKAQAYIKLNRLDEAKKTVEEIFSTKTTSKQPYLYVAQIQLKEGNLKSANESIDKLLSVNSQHLEALETKTEILKALGKTKEYEEYTQKANKIKQDRKKNGITIIRGKDGNN